jgi:uncharacterized membrane protein
MVDRFPDGDPRWTLQNLLKPFAKKSIQYHFGTLTQKTDQMVRKFAAAYDDLGGLLDVCDFRDAVNHLSVSYFCRKNPHYSI